MIYSNYMREKYRNTNVPRTAEGYPCILKKAKKGNLKELVIDGNVGNVGEASKNLIKYPYSFGTSVTHKGVTFTVDSDGAVILNGTPTGGIAQCNLDTRNFLNILDSTKDYILSGVIEPDYNSDGSYTKCQINMAFTKSGTWVKNIAPVRPGVSTKINLSNVTEEFNECHIQILAYGGTFDNVKFYPQIEEGTKRTEWCPNGKCYIVIKNDGENRDTVKTKIITDSPIGDNECLRVHDSDVKIPVFKGENVISTETTVQPKSLKAKYIKY